MNDKLQIIRKCKAKPFFNVAILQFLIFNFLIIISGCKVDDIIVDESTAYPQEIGEIILTKCAVSGCHNNISKEAAAGLSLQTWNKMFEGGNSGAVTIPYTHGQSTLFLFSNTYSDLGVSVVPTMPIGAAPLSKQEMITLKKWIDDGAPDKNGIVKFSDNRNRKKVYIANQGCDLVAVLDEETNLIMRYVNVGNSESIESPHMVRVSPDGKYWYVVFYAGSVVQKFNAIDDSYVGEAEIGYGAWNTIAISADSKTAFAVDWSSNGRIACIDLETMALKTMYQGSGLFIYPHGITIHPNQNYIYVTAQTGNFIYKINISDINFPEIDEISLAPGESPSTISSLDPHESIFSPDLSSYYVSCQKSNEVRVMDALSDTLLKIIPTGEYPSEFSISESNNYIFVSCPEDTSSFPELGHGCVTVINYLDNSVVTKIYAGYQPHGIAVDENKQIVYVANRNIYSSGPTPHHTTECGGRNGYMTIIDMNSLTLTNTKTELSVDPYSVVIR